jgi:hypothetical protein
MGVTSVLMSFRNGIEGLGAFLSIFEPGLSSRSEQRERKIERGGRTKYIINISIILYLYLYLYISILSGGGRL